MFKCNRIHNFGPTCLRHHTKYRTKNITRIVEVRRGRNLQKARHPQNENTAFIISRQGIHTSALCRRLRFAMKRTICELLSIR